VSVILCHKCGARGRRRGSLVQEVVLQLYVMFGFALKYCFMGLS
jgi:hypothetical protein